MPRGIAWENLPTPSERFNPKRKLESKTDLSGPEFTMVDDTGGQEKGFDAYAKEAKNIASRGLFGFLSGALTGAVFGTGTAYYVFVLILIHNMMSS